MNPYTFPGLKATSKLYYDLQAMIAVNGGRQRLADIIEAEWVKIPTWREKHHEIDRRDSYTPYELSYIKANYGELSAETIAEEIGRPLFALRQKIARMQVMGELDYKIRSYGH